MNFKELATERYSCRKLSAKPVEKEKLDQIIASAIAAPTAVNKQPYRIFVFSSEEAKKNVQKATAFTFGADTFLMVGAKKDEAWVRQFDQRNFADVDAAIVATHIMLQLKDLGLDSTWVGHFDAPLLQGIYPQLKDYDLIAIFPIGYAHEDSTPSVRHFERKDPKDVVVEL